MHTYKEIEAMVSGSLLPQEYEMEYTTKWIIMNLSKTIYIPMIHIKVASSHLSHNRK